MEMRDRVFRHEDLKDFNNRYVAVRLLGGLDATEESREHWRRYGVSSFPATIVLAGDGALLKREQGALATPAELLKLMASATAKLKEYQLRRPRLALDKSAPGRIKHARYLFWRGLLEVAEQQLRGIPEDASTLEGLQLLVDVYERLGRVAERERVLTRMIETYPADPRRMWWAMRRSTNSIATRGDFVTDGRPGAERYHLDRIALLRTLLAEPRSDAERAVIRWDIAIFYDLAAGVATGERVQRHKAAAAAEWAWIRDHPIFVRDEPAAVLAQSAALVKTRPRDAERIMGVLDVLREIAAQRRWPYMASRARGSITSLTKLATSVGDEINAEILPIVRKAGRSPPAYEAALTRARFLTKLVPARRDYLNTLGVALYRAGQYEESRKTLAALTGKSQGAGEGEALFVLAACHARLGKVDAAKAAFVRAMAWRIAALDLPADRSKDLEAIEAEAEAQLAEATGETGWGARYRERWKRHEQDPDWARVRQPGQQPEVYVEALRRARLALELRLGDPEILTTIGLALYRSGKQREAEDLLSAKVKTFPKPWHALGSLVVSLSQVHRKLPGSARYAYYHARDAGRAAAWPGVRTLEQDFTTLQAEAEAALSQATGEKDWSRKWREGWTSYNSWATWNVVEESGRTQEEYERALERARAEFDAMPDNHFVWVTLGTALYRMGEYVEARAFATRAVNGGEPAKRILGGFLDAMSCVRLGEVDQARRAYVVARDHLAKLDASNFYRPQLNRFHPMAEAVVKEVTGEGDWDRKYREGWLAFHDQKAWRLALQADAKADQYEQALGLARAAREMHFSDPRVAATLLLALYRLGRYAEAGAVSLERVGTDAQWSAAIRYTLAMCLAHVEKPDVDPLRSYARGRLNQAAAGWWLSSTNQCDALRKEAEGVLRERLGSEDFEAAYKAYLEAGFLGVVVEASEGGGVRVTKVVAKSPAATAGLEVGDVILRVADQEPADRDSFHALARSLEPGDEVDIILKRGEKTITVQVKVGRRGDFLR